MSLTCGVMSPDAEPPMLVSRPTMPPAVSSADLALLDVVFLAMRLTMEPAALMAVMTAVCHPDEVPLPDWATVMMPSDMSCSA